MVLQGISKYGNRRIKVTLAAISSTQSARDPIIRLQRIRLFGNGNRLLNLPRTPRFL